MCLSKLRRGVRLHRGGLRRVWCLDRRSYRRYVGDARRATRTLERLNRGIGSY